MDINRLPNDKKLELCKWYFKVGCLFLPFLWAVNAVWFFRDAFTKPEFNEQKEIRRYVLMSASGAAVWSILMIAWLITYQLERAGWGPTGDMLSFIVPLGRA